MCLLPSSPRGVGSFEVQPAAHLFRLFHYPLCREPSPPRRSSAEPEQAQRPEPNARSRSPSLCAPARWSRSARPMHLRIRHLIDLRKHYRCFIFKDRLHRFEVAFRVFSRAILKSQVTQIVVDGVAALQELVELAAVRRKVRSIRLNVKNEKTDGDGQGQARPQYRPSPAADSYGRNGQEAGPQ